MPKKTPLTELRISPSVSVLQPDNRSDQEVLEDFVLKNPELNKLESLLDQFNVFEAMRAERTEARHSDFLAFLLDPIRPHGLGDVVLKSILQAVLKAKGDYPPGITPIDLDSWDMTTAVVTREESNIDILIRYEPPGRRLAVIIENKIDSAEHSNQLCRYYDGIAATVPDAQIIAVYLTREGEVPSDERFLPLDYGVVADVLESILGRRRKELSEAVGLALEHYVSMLRRHIVTESELARLAKVILEKHRRALDILFEYRPDVRMVIMERLSRMIRDTPGLTLARASKSHVSFLIDSLAKIPGIDSGDTNYYINDGKQLLYVEFKLREQNVACGVVVGPGPAELRRKIVDMANKDQELFNSASGSLNTKYKTILSRKVLTKRDLTDDTQANADVRLNSWWSDFRSRTLPAMTAAFEKLVLR